MEAADRSEISNTSHERRLQAWSDLRRHQILLDADEFVTKYDLDDLRSEIRTGALLLEDPDHVEGLTDADVSELAEEKQPLPIFSEVLTKQLPFICSIGGMLWGWTDGLISQPTLDNNLLPDLTEKTSRILDMFMDVEPTYWICRIVGLWCAVPLLRCFGRRHAAYAVVGLRLAGILSAMLFPNLYSSGTSGAVNAMGKGMFLCIMPMYLAETSPIPTRAIILLTWQLTQGIGFFYGLVFATMPNSFNRDIPVIFLLIGVAVCFWFSPESPYWHFYRGEMRQAYKVLLKRRRIAPQASRDLYRMYSFRASNGRASWNNARGAKRHLPQALAITAITAILIISLTVPAISGNLVLISLSTMGFDAFVFPTGMVLFVLAVGLFGTAIALVERIGRRRLVLGSMAIMFLILLVNMLTARAYLWGFSRWDLGIPHVVLLSYGVLSMLIQLYATEVACSFGRDAVMAVIMTIYSFRGMSATYLAAKIVQRQGRWFGSNYLAGAPMLLFLALYSIFIFLICVLLVETRRRSLEEIRAAFDFSIANRVTKSVRVYSSYIAKRLSLSRREELEPEESEYGTGLIRLQDGDVGSEFGESSVV